MALLLFSAPGGLVLLYLLELLFARDHARLQLGVGAKRVFEQDDQLRVGEIV